MRPVTTDDLAALRGLLDEASPESRWRRFFGQVDLEKAAEWAALVNGRDRCGLVIEIDGHLVAHGIYIRAGHDTAEVAFLVLDRWQHDGIATILLYELARIATSSGIRAFTAEVLATNQQMLEVFADSGFDISVQATHDVTHVRVSLSGFQHPQ